MRRPCGVCGQPIPTTDLRRTTCGHPRCVRTWRETAKAKREAQKNATTHVPRENDMRARVLRLMMGATNGGVSEFVAIVAVSRITGESPATVRSIWVSAQPEYAKAGDTA